MSSKKQKPKSADTHFDHALFSYILDADDNTLNHIASRDYGMEKERHLAALKTIIREQNGYISLHLGQVYYPADVVELAAYDPAHAHAYTISHLMMIQSQIKDTCCFDLSAYRAHYQTHRVKLPSSMQKELDSAYQYAEQMGEIDENRLGG